MTLFGEGAGFDRREVLGLGLRGAGLVSVAGIVGACGGATTTARPASGLAGPAPGAPAPGAPAPGAPAQTPGPSGSGTPKRGGTLTVGVISGGASETVNPFKWINQSDLIRTTALYNGLYQVGNGGVVPRLATSAEPNKDGTVWTLHLREGVRWHDGKPFSADDVLYTMNTWKDPTQNYMAPTALPIIDLNHVRKRGPLTVEVPMTRPFAPFQAILSAPQAYIVQNGFRNFNHPIGTGPFKFQSFSPGSSSTFVANGDYWGGAPYVDRFVVNSSFTDAGAILDAVVGGSVTVAPSVPPALAKAHAGTSTVVLGNARGPGIVPLVMRVNVPPFNDPRVIRAFKLIPNRQAFMSDVFDGYATLGNDVVGAGLEYWASDLKPSHDPEQAKSLLKAAGREGMTIPIYTAPAVPGMVETATLYAAQAAAAGVTVHVKQLPVASYFTSAAHPAYLSNQRHFSLSYFQDLAAIAEFYIGTLVKNCAFDETGWAGSHPAGSNLVLDAMGELDPAKAADKWHAVQEQQLATGGYIMPANVNFLDAYASNVRNGNTTLWGDNSQYDYTQTWLA
jgi:peptide/nickel transport system substrate-binding protein